MEEANRAANSTSTVKGGYPGRQLNALNIKCQDHCNYYNLYQVVLLNDTDFTEWLLQEKLLTHWRHCAYIYAHIALTVCDDARNDTRMISLPNHLFCNGQRDAKR